jgi:DNA-binding response OmpR family regulator
VIKPFRFATLLARIRAHPRDYEASEDAVFTIGPLHVPAELETPAQSRG